MGMFDSVMVKCPYCGIENELQTKNGQCILGKYDLINAPPQVLLGVEGNHECKHRDFNKLTGVSFDGGCGEWFNVSVQCITKAWVDKLAAEEEK